MARPTHLWLGALTVFALSACSGSETGFFSDGGAAGAGGSSHAGASSKAGSGAISGSGNAGSSGAGRAGENSGDGGGGAQSAGASSGGASSGGGNRGGAAGVGIGGHTSAGTGGRAGAGGSAAAAGHGGTAGGAAGSAGGSSSCNELLQQASQQLEAARACNPELDSLHCTGKVTNQCGCQVPVERTESAETKAYLKTLKQLEDKNCVIVCTAIVCPLVSDAQCKASSGSTMGSCQATNHGPTP